MNSKRFIVNFLKQILLSLDKYSRQLFDLLISNQNEHSINIRISKDRIVV